MGADPAVMGLPPWKCDNINVVDQSLTCRTLPSRRAFLNSLAVAFPQASRKKPNILFILTDDQRQDTIAAMGNPHIRTPNLDSLVTSGLTFVNAYCMGGYIGAVCTPSRMMIQRGRAWFSVRNQPPDYPCLPRSMKEGGYVTFHLGKKGNVDKQSNELYDHNLYMEPDDVAERESGRPGQQVADRTIGFLKDWKKDANRKPFFMYLAGPAPHDPRIAPPEYLAKYDPARLPLPPNYKPFHPFDNGEMLIRDEQLAPWPRTETEIRRHLQEYYAVIEAMDAQFGRIFAQLKAMGEYDNTIIVFTQDQGIAIGSHGLMGKQNLYEHSMRSGLILTGPGIPRNRRVNSFAYLFDIYPTLCDFAGVPIASSLEGRSLLPVIQGKSTVVRDTIFLAYRDVQRAVRLGRWKLIRYPKINRSQLFDLEEDPYELRDLAGDVTHRTLVAELMALMVEQQKLFGDSTALTSDKPSPGEVTLEFFQKAKAQ